METVSHRGHTGNRSPVGPGRFSHVLEDDLESQEASWEKTDSEAGAAVDVPDGCRESHLVSAAHPWRTSHARSRYLGTNHLPVG